MKKTETFIVLRNKKTGNFLLKYKSKEQTLAYSAEYTKELNHAAKNEVEATKIQIEDFTNDGEEPEELIEGTEASNEEEFKRFLKMLETGMED